MLLEDPVFVIAGLVAAAVISGFLLNRAGRARAAVAIGAALLALAGGAYLLAAGVRTDRETVADATVELVEAVAHVDESALRRLLADGVRLRARAGIPGVPVPELGLERDRIIDAVRAVMADYPITEHDPHELSVAMTGPDAARSQLRVRVVAEGWNFAHNSYWRLDWRRDPQRGWQATFVTPWSMDGLGSTTP